MTVDHSIMKLGKQPSRHDPRTLRLADYIDSTTLPAAPPERDWGASVDPKAWGMMLNDHTGDCTCAAAAHLIQDWTANNEGEFTIPDPEILAAYQTISGYDPKTGANDNGAVATDVLNYWRKSGIGGRTIKAYVSLEPGNHGHVKDAVNLFGGCYIGLALPVSAQSQVTWTVPPEGDRGRGAPGSWGGHAVSVVAYNPRRVTCVTWGELKQMTWGFFDAYCDEAYSVLSEDWGGEDRLSPAGFDLETLEADLKQLSAHPIPVGVGG